MRDDILHVVLPIVLTDFVNGLLAAASVLQVAEDHERHCVTPRIAPMITPVSPRGDQIGPVSAIRSGTGGRASQPGAAFTAAINMSKATRLSTRLIL